MAALDIGIDLGTTTVIISMNNEIVLSEPSVVAIKSGTEEVLSVGQDAYVMLGRTPSTIKAIKPLSDGVISDYKLTEHMIKYFMRKVYGNSVIKPRVAICVPSVITNVESNAVVDAATQSGARRVYLIKEPVAAAIGAGIDISKPNGVMIIDIGGGTTDISVISLNGIVTETSIKTAGNKFDSSIIKYMKSEYNLVVGEKMAEMVKREIGNVYVEHENRQIDIKGRNLITGLPQKITICTDELYDVLKEPAEVIAHAVHGVLERTPPELVGDIYTNGAILTGGGALIGGLDRLISERTKIHTTIAEDPINCVALGTGKCFEFLDSLVDGFITPSTHQY
ncbi:rod shape-determining protein [Candidatus Soleaferrea massiliensis]|uniref:rod shape-determining protein n=1 Tax=Candidatus Soleaferrea massiliensis TaxID=1470354 RepID=UPI0005912E25|nr:rod shape-determining protein [Candidatus Soleaferrea massiliensis]